MIRVVDVADAVDVGQVASTAARHQTVACVNGQAGSLPCVAHLQSDWRMMCFVLSLPQKEDGAGSSSWSLNPSFVACVWATSAQASLRQTVCTKITT